MPDPPARPLRPILPTPGHPRLLQEGVTADTVREKIEDAGKAAKDAARVAGGKAKAGAETGAEKTANAAHAAGQAVKESGEKLKDQSGV